MSRGLRWLDADHIMDVFEPALVIACQRRPLRVQRIDEFGGLGVRKLGQVVHFHLFAQSLGVRRAPGGRWNRPDGHVGPETDALHFDVTRRHLVRVARRGEQKLGALALVHANRADIDEGLVPVIRDLAEHYRLVVGRGYLKHDRPFSKVGHRKHIGRDIVRRQSLELRRCPGGHGQHDVVAAADGKCAAPQTQFVDHGHGPQNGLEGALIQHLILEGAKSVNEGCVPAGGLPPIGSVGSFSAQTGVARLAASNPVSARTVAGLDFIALSIRSMCLTHL